MPTPLVNHPGVLGRDKPGLPIISLAFKRIGLTPAKVREMLGTAVADDIGSDARNALQRIREGERLKLERKAQAKAQAKAMAKKWIV